MRRPWLLLLTALAAGSALLCAAILAVGLTLTAPAPSNLGALPDGLPGVEAVAFPSASGSMLHGWWAPGQPGGGAVLLLHGIGENRRRMLPRARILHQHGFATLLIDLQAHGESPGRRITLGRLEALDAAAAATWLHARLPTERIGAIGFSLGGAATLLGPEPLQIDALVLESVYPDIDSALANRLKTGLGRTLGPIATPILVPLFNLLLPPILGVHPRDLRPIDRIATIRTPLLLASGTADDRTPLTEAKALFDRAPQPKQFWPVEGAAHTDLERYAPEAYWHAVLPFLTQHLRHP